MGICSYSPLRNKIPEFIPLTLTMFLALPAPASLVGLLCNWLPMVSYTAKVPYPNCAIRNRPGVDSSLGEST